MALPGDINSPSAPGDPDPHGRPGQIEDARPADASRPADAASTSDEEPGSLPGLPKLFFAAGQEANTGEPAQRLSPGAARQAGSAGQSGGPDQPGSVGQPGDASPQPGFDPRGNFGQPQRPGLGQRHSPGRPAQPQPGRSQRPLPSKPPDRELRHRALASLVLSVLALVALLGLGGDLHRGVYLLIFSAVVGIGSCVIGITAVVKARKTGCYRPRGSIGGIVLGAMAAVLSIPILATYLAFPRQVDNYVKCLNQNRSGNEQSCMDKFYKSIHLGWSARDDARDGRTID
jgi:hypothetical protein